MVYIIYVNIHVLVCVAIFFIAMLTCIYIIGRCICLTISALIIVLFIILIGDDFQTLIPVFIFHKHYIIFIVATANFCLNRNAFYIAVACQ